MPDPLAGLGGNDDASALAPAVTAADIEKIKAELAAQFDERAKGFQRLLAERDAVVQALSKEIEDQRLAGLSEDERAELLDRKKDERIAQLEAELELKELSGTFMDEMPYFERLIKADSTEAQLQVMREFRTALAAAQPSEAPPAGDDSLDVPDVEPNRPMRRWDPSIRFGDGQVMDEATADRILGSIGRQADVTQRRRG